MSDEKKKGAYAEAGVDIDKGNEFVRGIKDIVKATHQPEVLSDIGGFSSLFAIDPHEYEKPVIVTSTDGVGTKLDIAKRCNKHDTIGVDLVAMCVNDIVVGGAKPLCFLDYYSVGKLELDVATEVVRGIAVGCIQAQCSLVGGETAEMPGLYKEGDYDLAGFVVGIGDRDDLIDGSDIKVGDKIIGLASSGVHSNGFSLVRKICFQDNDFDVDDFIKEFGCTLGEELLKPTKIYVHSVLGALARRNINGLIHNTGGGFIDNIPRVLPQGTKAIINKGSWSIPPIFPFMAEKGEVPEDEMYRTFNMGIGMMAVVDANMADSIVDLFQNLGEKACIIGEVFKVVEGESRVKIL